MSSRMFKTSLFSCLILFFCASGSAVSSDAEQMADPSSWPAPRLNPGQALDRAESANFVGSGQCAPCHHLLKDKAGKDMSIPGHWQSTMMANAAKDPLWQAKVASESKRNPAIKEIIEKKCVTCHMPMAWIQNQAMAPGQETSTKGGILHEFVKKENALHALAMDGVSCSFCHQIQDKDLGTDKSFSGKYEVDTSATGPQRKIFGPYKISEKNIMQTSVGFTPEYGPQMNDSGLCATCHVLFTPYLNEHDEVAGTFPEQTVFLEWMHSTYAEPPGERHDIEEIKGQVRTCQECHMPHSEAGNVLIARYAPSGTEEKSHFSQHHFVGANMQMLDLLQNNINRLELTGGTDRFQDTKDRTLRQLQNDTATLTITDTDRSGSSLKIDLLVTNKVGHKFPTGFPSRRAWVHLQVLDQQGKTVFESGRPMADGSVQGDDANESQSYEPHHQTITTGDQVQIYEAVMANTQGEVTLTLLRAAQYLKDSRLLPDGFDKATAQESIKVYGKAVDDPDFKGGSDLIRYQVDIVGSSGELTVKADLYFTAVSAVFVNDLRVDDDLPLVKKFLELWDKGRRGPALITSAQTVIK